MNKSSTPFVLLVCTALVLSAMAQPPSQTGFLVQWTGTKAENDLGAAELAIAEENVRRSNFDPPVDPLPNGTQPEIVASYETILVNDLEVIHADNIAEFIKADSEEFVELLENSSKSQRDAAKADLTN